MEAKYYTPEIEEFHIGFEYQTYMMSNGGYIIWDMKDPSMSITKEPDNHMWFTTKFRFSLKGPLDQPYTLEQIRQFLTEDRIRVKHLDKEDIEILGLQVQITPCGEDTEDYEDIYQDGAVIGSFFPEDEMNVQLMDTYFKVKNKSEFQRLLKQLDLL